MRSLPTRRAALVRSAPIATALAALLVLACGSSSGGGFPITSPISDVCGILTLADAQTVVPTVDTFGVEPTADTPDLWNRICHYSNSQTLGASANLDLVLQGALTDKGAAALDAFVSTGLGSSHTAVSGVGERAIFFDQSGMDQGLVAKSGGYAVDVTVYFADTPVTAQQLVPPVNKAISKLP